MTDSATILTDAQLAHYRDRGYVIPDFRLPESVVEDLRADHARLVTRHPELRQYCPNLLHYDLRFLEIARTPEIVAMVSQLLGPDLALWNSSLFAKPANDGKRTPWHQDGQYWPIRPLATCTVWIALDDSTTQNGCLRILSLPSYPNAQPAALVAERLAQAGADASHEFWPDGLSLLEPGRVRWDRVLGSRQVTDVHLLARAVSRGGRLVTFDRSIARDAVPGAKAAHLVTLDG